MFDIVFCDGCLVEPVTLAVGTTGNLMFYLSWKEKLSMLSVVVNFGTIV